MMQSIVEGMTGPWDHRGKGLPHPKIGSHLIGPGEPVYVVAELSANHGQDFDEAVRLVHAAKDAGADAVKLQTYTPDTLTMKSDNPLFTINETVWQGRQLYDLYDEAQTPA